MCVILVGYSMMAWAGMQVSSLSAWLMGGRWQHVTIHSGDTWSGIFKSRKWSRDDAYKILQLPNAKHALSHLHPGQQLEVMVHKGRVLTAHIPVSHEKTLIITAKSPGFTESFRITKHTMHLQHKILVIKRSLFQAAKQHGLSARMIANLTTIFQDQIDLNRHVRQGDTVAVTYRAPASKQLGDTTLLDAKYCHAKQCWRAVRFTDDHGVTGYYTPKGYSVQLAFDRSPLRHFHVSSSFSRHRWHPVLHRWRSHLGVDLAAKYGSKIHATSAGRVIFSGRKGGYGNVVIIQHGRRYRTVYAHMSKIAKISHVGRRVYRGQVIGYVGQTGIATGPHCHYEFRINGRAMNPMRVHLPKQHRLVGQDMQKFKQVLKAMNQWQQV